MRWEAKYYRGEGQALEMERKVWGQAFGWTARGQAYKTYKQKKNQNKAIKKQQKTKREEGCVVQGGNF